MKAGKIWGDTVNIFSNHNFEFHRIQVKKGGYCSKHKHLHKFNGFYIESGELVISVWKEYNLVDKTILSTDEFTIVSPGEYHLFEAAKDTIAFELYWAKFDADDIVRENQGGTVKVEEVK